jgi:hypothetical protein
VEDLQIEVLDSIMGSGKTTGIIKWMKDNPQNKYLYVSPLLSEVEERIPTECEELEFVSPNTLEHKTKADHLKDLLTRGMNISFTHSLFTSLTKEHLRLINLEQYVLIIDEEIDFIDQYQGKDYRRGDIVTLERSGHIRVDEDNLGRVHWIWDEDKFEENSTYGKLKRMCDLEMLHCAKRDRGMIVLHLPIALISASSRTIVMTYLFEGSVMNKFMEMKGVTVKPFTEVQMIKTEAQVKSEACGRINLVDTASTKKVSGVSKSRLTATWYRESCSNDDLKAVANAIRSVCRKFDKSRVLYTLPKHLVLPDKGKPKIKITGYPAKDCFLYSGTKATNMYSDRDVLVHAFNRHPLVPVSAYLQDYGFPVDSDHFALSELIQWVWRSAIRNGGTIQLSIISYRMKRIFEDWLNG